MENISLLTTEEFNPKSNQLDEMSTGEILQIMNEEDYSIASAVQKVLPKIEETVDKVVAAFQADGRLIYVGAGTSGRIGVLDAVECPPTFSTSPEMVKAVLAGGNGAMFTAVEGAEDDEELGAVDLQNLRVTEKDVIIGIAASGRTPYVKGALKYANGRGATTVSLTSNEKSSISEHADIHIEVITGPEILTGSTRLRAATAHKMVLNMISTTSMIKLGKVYKNLMVDLNASNFKLRERAKTMVCTITGSSYQQEEETLEQTEYDVKLAIVMLMAKVDKDAAKEFIHTSRGFVGEAIKLASGREG